MKTPIHSERDDGKLQHQPSAGRRDVVKEFVGKHGEGDGQNKKETVRRLIQMRKRIRLASKRLCMALGIGPISTACSERGSSRKLRTLDRIRTMPLRSD